MTTLTHQQRLEAIRQKIVEANPEIMELKFGCWLWMNATNLAQPLMKLCYINNPIEYPDGNAGCRFIDEKGNVKFFHDMHEWDITGDEPEYDVEIIGRPICLADVLLAASKVKLFVASNGGLCQWTEDENRYGEMRAFALWNLRKDSLDAQSEECISFLHSLLCS